MVLLVAHGCSILAVRLRELVALMAQVGKRCPSSLTEASGTAAPSDAHTWPSIAANMLAGTAAFIEIFAGCARLTAAMAELGLRTACPIENKHGPWCDVECESVCQVILQWLERGLIWYAHFGTPCTNHSRARTTAKHEHSMAPLEFTARCLEVCVRKEIHWSLENPRDSGIWRHPLILPYMGMATIVEWDNCRYGACYRKATKLITSLGSLSALHRRCAEHPNPQHEHEILEGTVRVISEDGQVRTCWKTQLAGRYVPELVRAWAAQAKLDAPAGAIAGSTTSTMSVHWQRWLMAARGKFGWQRSVPTCPEHFESGWEDAISKWDKHEERQARKASQAAARQTSRGGVITKAKVQRLPRLQKKPARVGKAHNLS